MAGLGWGVLAVIGGAYMLRRYGNKEHKENRAPVDPRGSERHSGSSASPRINLAALLRARSKVPSGSPRPGSDAASSECGQANARASARQSTRQSYGSLDPICFQEPSASRAGCSKLRMRWLPWPPTP